jgi:hypothetical protein
MIGEPHSEQNIRWTGLPDVPFPVHLFVGSVRVTLSLGMATASTIHADVDQMPRMPRYER